MRGGKEREYELARSHQCRPEHLSWESVHQGDAGNGVVILDNLAEGETAEAFVASYPSLTSKTCRAALHYAGVAGSGPHHSSSPEAA